jgi:hypothetical protein
MNLFPKGIGVKRDEHLRPSGTPLATTALGSLDRVQVIAQPPWWTLDRLRAAVAFLIFGRMLMFLWFPLLRRQVGVRTAQLQRKMSERERARKRPSG